MLSIGSSLRVTPAAHMFAACSKKGGKSWIINLQKTPYTKSSTQIYAKIDDVLRMLMMKLGMDIPVFKLRRFARFTMQKKDGGGGGGYLSVCGIDETGMIWG